MSSWRSQLPKGSTQSSYVKKPITIHDTIFKRFKNTNLKKKYFECKRLDDLIYINSEKDITALQVAYNNILQNTGNFNISAVFSRMRFGSTYKESGMYGVNTGDILNRMLKFVKLYNNDAKKHFAETLVKTKNVDELVEKLIKFYVVNFNKDNFRDAFP